MMRVLVSGAIGNVGSGVVQELRGRGVSIRAFVRDPARAAEKLGEGVELAAGDFSDTESLRRALEGVDYLFLTSADGLQKVEHETTVIDTEDKVRPHDDFLGEFPYLGPPHENRTEP
jgi:uncharacterized protein YbjT (DUF2867 family)